jgi:hypothetical protein
MFKPRFARKSLRRYRKKGLLKLERAMVAAVSSEDLSGARVLEVGGGIGTIQAEFLAAGASQGEIVELVAAYEPYARELAHDKGLEGRTTFRVADLLDDPESVAPADIVVLNRVVCCSPDGVHLKGVAAQVARRILLISFPRDRWYVRVVVRVVNGALRVIRRPFQVFLHSPASLAAAAEAAGLRIATSGRDVAWEYYVLRRSR